MDKKDYKKMEREVEFVEKIEAQLKNDVAPIKKLCKELKEKYTEISMIKYEYVLRGKNNGGDKFVLTIWLGEFGTIILE